MITKTKTITLPADVLAAVVLALVGIDEILNTGQLTEDTVQEFEYIRPALHEFIDKA